MKTPPLDFVNIIFEKYLDSVYPDARPNGTKLPPLQHKELKNAFFAAFWSALHEISQVSATLPERQAFAVLESMQEECRRHASDIIQKWYRTN